MADDSNPPPGKKQSGLKGLAQAESMIQLALAIPAGAFVGLGLGYCLDRHFHTRWIAVTLMFLGAAGACFQLFSYLSRSSDRGGQ